MIKIIKKGKEIIECNKCGCKFTYGKDDIQQRLGKWVEGPFGDVQCIEEYVICPQCQTYYFIY